jgi:uncharacterized SAM-binding protein YcdF (DUF218 family)
VSAVHAPLVTFPVWRLLLAGTALFLLFAIVLGWHADKLLVSEDPPASADLVIVLAGSIERSVDAAQFMRSGYAPRVWISRPARLRSHLRVEALAGVRIPREEDLHRSVLLAMGVAPGAICVLGVGSESTLQEIGQLRAALPAEAKRVAIVTSRLHTRRVRMILEQVFADQPQREFLVLAGGSGDRSTRWWQSRESAHDVIFELLKTANHVFRGGSAPGASGATAAVSCD